MTDGHSEMMRQQESDASIKDPYHEKTSERAIPILMKAGKPVTIRSLSQQLHIGHVAMRNAAIISDRLEFDCIDGTVSLANKGESDV